MVVRVSNESLLVPTSANFISIVNTPSSVTRVKTKGNTFLYGKKFYEIGRRLKGTMKLFRRVQSNKTLFGISVTDLA
jgi:hypothetical protein